MRRSAAAVGVTVVLGTAAVAFAHHNTATFSSVDVRGRQASWVVQVRTADLGGPLGLGDAAPVEAIAERRAEAIDYVDRRLAVFDDTRACATVGGALERASEAPEPAVRVTIRYECPRAIETLRLRYELFFDLDPLHQGFANVAFGAGAPTPAVFRAGLRELVLERPLGAAAIAADYARLGATTAVTSHEHLAALLALVVGAAVRARGEQRPSRGARSVARAAAAVAAFVAAAVAVVGIAVLHPELVVRCRLEAVLALGVVAAVLSSAVRSAWWRGIVRAAAGTAEGIGVGAALVVVGLPAHDAGVGIAAFAGGLVGVALAATATAVVVFPLVRRIR